MEPTAKTSQPQAATEMKVMKVSGETAQNHQHEQCEHQKQKASRLRGGGAGKALSAVSFASNVVRDAASVLRISFAALARCAARCRLPLIHAYLVPFYANDLYKSIVVEFN
ncbi:hypothetical protein CVT25_004612 [Psilocybe cyanescens]|uniref:Uncharacterized protein n=1 Tax=Psilocybe cyanescens TaxID=93625 RepID=A0A409VS53_PSICY|nr:hypothetical protein CVT25_004612 [Psilocybe cyanescens]